MSEELSTPLETALDRYEAALTVLQASTSPLGPEQQVLIARDAVQEVLNGHDQYP